MRAYARVALVSMALPASFGLAGCATWATSTVAVPPLSDKVAGGATPGSAA
jgi:hypothetical protein